MRIVVKMGCRLNFCFICSLDNSEGYGLLLKKFGSSPWIKRIQIQMIVCFWRWLLNGKCSHDTWCISFGAMHTDIYIYIHHIHNIYGNFSLLLNDCFFAGETTHPSQLRLVPSSGFWSVTLFFLHHGLQNLSANFPNQQATFGTDGLLPPGFCS